jgi:cardiolipin synthase
VTPGISKRRLTGIDRSGPPPEATQAGHPLNPWTVPNTIDYLRLLGIPVFLVVAFSSDDGQDALAVVLFAVIGWSDYLDGFLARLTGQYSRLGALLDPLVDRLLIVSGMVVCWHFNLLPHWAIAIVIARELFMLAASRYALSHGVEIQINWPGRLGVAPIAGAPFFAMAGVHWLALIMLYVGMALGLVSAFLYVRRGTRQTLKLRLSLVVGPAILAPSRTRTRTHPEDLIYMDTFPDLGSLTDQELKELIKQLTDEEMEISYRRRILHGKIDILRAELVNRLRKKDETGELVITGADVQQLTDILAGRVPGAESE